jgi:hypothetical protein
MKQPKTTPTYIGMKFQALASLMNLRAETLRKCSKFSRKELALKSAQIMQLLRSIATQQNT